MRILFDENAPARLFRDLPEHECESVARLGWRGTKNGAQLALAEKEGFDVLITLDDDIQEEQNMSGRKIAILVLRPRRQGTSAARELIGRIRMLLAELSPGQIRLVLPEE